MPRPEAVLPHAVAVYGVYLFQSCSLRHTYEIKVSVGTVMLAEMRGIIPSANLIDMPMRWDTNKTRSDRGLREVGMADVLFDDKGACA